MTKKFKIAVAMAAVPWALSVFINIWLGLAGLSIQLSGLALMQVTDRRKGAS